MHGTEPPSCSRLYPNPLDEAKKTALHQWGMAIDLDGVRGFAARACSRARARTTFRLSGRDQVRRGREMHWMRIDRYYTANPAKKKVRMPSRRTTSSNLPNGLTTCRR